MIWVEKDKEAECDAQERRKRVAAAKYEVIDTVEHVPDATPYEDEPQYDENVLRNVPDRMSLKCAIHANEYISEERKTAALICG